MESRAESVWKANHWGPCARGRGRRLGLKRPSPTTSCPIQHCRIVVLLLSAHNAFPLSMNSKMLRDQKHDCRHNFRGEALSQLNGGFAMFETRLTANSWPAIWPTSRPGCAASQAHCHLVYFVQLEIFSFLLSVASVRSHLSKIYLSLLCILQYLPVGLLCRLHNMVSSRYIRQTSRQLSERIKTGTAGVR